MYTMALDYSETTNQRWQALMAKALATASAFEIHCWAEETEEIAMALSFGTLQESAWPYGKIVAGSVTAEFAAFLLHLPKPTDTEIYNKMTPFFTIGLDNGFCSEHYGTELNSLKPFD